MENKKGVYQNTLAAAATAGSLDMSAGLPRQSQQQPDLQVSAGPPSPPTHVASNGVGSATYNTNSQQHVRTQHQHATNTIPNHPIPHTSSSLLLQQQQQIRMLQYDMRVPPITSPMSSPTGGTAHQHPPNAHPHLHHASSYLQHHHHQHNHGTSNNNVRNTPQSIYGHMHCKSSPAVTKNIHPNPMHELHLQQAHLKYTKQHNNTIYHQLTQQPQQQHQQSNLLMYQQAQSPVWVPQQAQSPIYHPHQVIVPGTQQEQSAVNQQEARQGAGPQTPKDGPIIKGKENLERRRSGGSTSGSQQLRSPSAKRPPNAPVAMQGWLYKQGSDGLMLWKKRWFVLSEYCMFYYKGPEEEKLLGSILLPSYKVSICSPDDRVNKKYAFKCEHTNMRTYLLAADSQELMMQWIRLINLACLLQSNIHDDLSSPRSQNPSVQSSPQTSKEMVFPKKQQPSYNSYPSPKQGPPAVRRTPVHMHSSSNTTDLSSPSQQELAQYNQPLYANAPPKPKRLNDGGYSSPSPDNCERYPPHESAYGQTNAYNNRQMPKSPVHFYNNNVPVEYSQRYHNTQEYLVQNVERRTPDTYGPSSQSNHDIKIGRHPTDYEDIYGEQYMYKRPLSPLAYTMKKGSNASSVPPMQRPYMPPSGSMHGLSFDNSQPAYIPKKHSSNVPRPHSADFLEYEANSNRQQHLIQRQSRPKSSLDINRSPSSDNYFYSEERYAENMRKSAQYLPHMHSTYMHEINALHRRQQLQQQQQQQLQRQQQQHHTAPLMRSTGNNAAMMHPSNATRIATPTRSRSVLSEGSLSRELDGDMGYSPSGRFNRVVGGMETNELLSPTVSAPRDQYGYEEAEARRNEYEQFARSASARLALSADNRILGDGGPSNFNDGDRKREESMKRLLEWKQRMLQSPLNRKMNQNIGKTYHPPTKQEIYAKNQTDPMVHGRIEQDPYYQNRRPNNTIMQYNSYSSDDEDNVADDHSSRREAGWTATSDTAYTTALITDTTLLPTLDTSEDPRSLVPLRHTDALNKPLQLSTKLSTQLAHVSSLRSEQIPFDGPGKAQSITASTTEIKTNGALVKSILAEFEKQHTALIANETASSSDTITPTNEMDTIVEENYMPMTPKKNVLDPLVTVNIDENPYVEMTQGIEHNINNSAMGETYELVAFANGKVEPLYMELRQPESLAGLHKLSKSIPDVMMPSSSTVATKSDSSDADDEASKDLDGMEVPSHPRFSLSDTFRPASYYLGTTQSSELQDSSDSELVSPPPIPRSPPPIEDFRKSDEHVNHKDSPKLTLISFNSFGKDDLSSTYSDDNDRLYTSRLSETSDSSDIDKRANISHCPNYEDLMKRRPLSEGFFDDLDSFNTEQLNETIDSGELDKYLKELQISNISLQSTDSNPYVHNFVNSSCMDNRFHDYENLCVANIRKLDLNISLLSPISHTCHNDKKVHDSRKLYDSVLDRSVLSSDIIPRTMTDSSISDNVTNSFHLNLTSNHSSPSKFLSTQEISLPITFSDLKPRDVDFSQLSLSQPAPYYYSDLSMNVLQSDLLTLNNKRESMNGNKRDISHIINPIRCNSQLRNSVTNAQDPSNKLASEARSVSVDFLNLTDKSGNIDKKNIYESDTLKRLKVVDSVNHQQNGELRNLLLFNNDKFLNSIDDGVLRRTHSLEGLLENVLITNENVTEITTSQIPPQMQAKHFVPSCNVTTEGSYLWEEDIIWRERLRSVSQRHTKSMDDLDFVGVSGNSNSGECTSPTRKVTRAITRDVTYVNDNIYNMPVREKSPEKETAATTNDEVVAADTIASSSNTSGSGSDRKEKDSFSIDREKLRQWDLMSSAPSESQSGDQSVRVSLAEVDPGDRVTGTQSVDSCEQPESASGSVSVHIRDTFPRAISSKQIWTPNHQNISSKSYTNLAIGNEGDYANSLKQGYCPNNQGPRPHNRIQADMNNYNSRKEHQLKTKVSAGELLGRTHEELVLLLIQLRRQSTTTCHAIEACYNEIDSIQAQLHLMDAAKRLESLQKLEQIKQHLLELERQYEKGKPLVNLVDNMVKLGSLYRAPNEHAKQNASVREKLEFNQQMQEQRLLAEERRDWHRIIPNHSQLQEKVQQLYQLDRLISEESGTLQNLQQDKEEIERALGGLRDRLVKGFTDPIMIEQARKQQMLLENELSRVHLMLAQNSKKLEETVVGNARLEQELLVLKQKLQISRQQRSSPQISNAGDSLPCIGSSAILESDLQRVQQNVGDLQRQRQELSMQVRQLTDRSHNLSAQNKQCSMNPAFNLQALGNKKKLQSLWRETDLDTMNIIDHGESGDIMAVLDSNAQSDLKPQIPQSLSQQHLQMHLQMQQRQQQQQRQSSPDRDVYYQTDEEQSHQTLLQEKPEPKTVRIVKRESERRQRDREKGSSTVKWESLQEEEDTAGPTVASPRQQQQQQQQQQQSRPTTLLPGTSYKLIAGSAPNLDELSPLVAHISDNNSGVLSRQSSLSSPSLPQNFPNVKAKDDLKQQQQQQQQQQKQNQGPLELSPVYKSEAAKQIITEMSSTAKPSTSNAPVLKSKPHKRAVPIEKRRHYTAPHNNMMKSLNQLPTDESMFGKDGALPERRARDDLDMERALRHRIDAPDVVRSTLSSKELKYNENTIDSLLGAPSKINIPERYIPEQSPQLSAEEQEMRLRKVESIKKMLSDTTLISGGAGSTSNNATDNNSDATSTLANKATSKMIEEKKQREHLLQLNQILAKQVMEMSKIVAVKALSKLPYEDEQYSDDEEPADPLPIYQQRDNFYS